jgi:hypothetical protein
VAANLEQIKRRLSGFSREIIRITDTGKEWSDSILRSVPAEGLVFFASCILLITMAVFPLSSSGSLTRAFDQLVPAGAWTLIGGINLGFIKDLVFKVIVLGGFFLQNRTRLVLLLAILIAGAYRLLKSLRSLRARSESERGSSKPSFNSLERRFEAGALPAWVTPFGILPPGTAAQTT